MNITSNLLNSYNCCICLEPMKTAVSFNPCGHEVNENCANTILSSTKTCPICRVDVESFRSAYVTRDAVAKILQSMKQSEIQESKTTQQPKITVKVINLLGHKYTYKMEKDSKAIELFKLLYRDTERHPSKIKLIYNQRLISPFSNLNEHFLSNDIEFKVHMTNRLDHWTIIAKDFPLIFERAIAETPSKGDLYEKFMSIYNQSIEEAMKNS